MLVTTSLALGSQMELKRRRQLNINIHFSVLQLLHAATTRLSLPLTIASFYPFELRARINLPLVSCFLSSTRSQQ